MPSLTFTTRADPFSARRRRVRRVKLGRRNIHAHLARDLVRPLRSTSPSRHPIRRSEAELRWCRSICQRNRTEERRRVQQVVEAMPKRFVKGDDAVGTGEPKAA